VDPAKSIRVATLLIVSVTLVVLGVLTYKVVEHLNQRPVTAPAGAAQPAAGAPSAGVSPPGAANIPGSPANEHVAGHGRRLQGTASALPRTAVPQGLPLAPAMTPGSSPAPPPPSGTPVAESEGIPPVSSGAAARPRTVVIPRGTPIRVKLEQSLSSEQSKTGQFFRAALASAVERDGVVALEAGSEVRGQVLQSKRSGVFGRRPELQLVLLEVRTADRRSLRIQTGTWDDTGRGLNPLAGTLRSAAGAVSGAVEGAARGSGLLPEECGQCKSNSRIIMLPTNSTLRFELVAPIRVTERSR
jgi:hypothetical protein